MIYIKRFVIDNVTAKKDAKTGIILNQSSEVLIDGSIGRNFSLPFSLICSQKIDNG